MPNSDRTQISEQEIKLLELFRQLGETDREMVLKITILAATVKKRKNTTRHKKGD